MNPILSDKPRLLKASHCPKGTDRIPPLITSAIKALENILKPNNNAENSDENFIPNKSIP